MIHYRALPGHISALVGSCVFRTLLCNGQTQLCCFSCAMIVLRSRALLCSHICVPTDNTPAFAQCLHNKAGGTRLEAVASLVRWLAQHGLCQVLTKIIGFDKIYGLVDKLGPPVNKLSNKLGSEAFWPTTLDRESDKAARILRSFCS